VGANAAVLLAINPSVPELRASPCSFPVLVSTVNNFSDPGLVMAGHEQFSHSTIFLIVAVPMVITSSRPTYVERLENRF
jgi:hypothetical protein